MVIGRQVFGFASVLAIACSGVIGSPGDDDEGGSIGAGGTSEPGASEPGGGEPTDPTSTDPSDPTASACTEAAPFSGPSLALTDVQLQTTIRALFPFDVQMPPMPTRPRGKHAFSTAMLTNEFTYNQVSIMTEAAEQIAAQAHDHLSEMMPCSVGVDGESCLTSFVDDFGARAFRRPVEADERDTLVGLYGALVADGVTPEIATTAVIAAILQSPQLLYQLDLGEPGGATDAFSLTSFELASHLAYLIVDAPPDDTLLALARDGTITDPVVFREQAERLLDDPRGRDMIKRFVTEWFDVEGADYATRLDPTLAGAFIEEIDRDLDAWLFGPTPIPLSGLLSQTTSFVNQPLAEHYGLATVLSSASDWQEVSLPAHYQGGLLTKALVSTRFSNLEEPSIILRGVFVLTELLCVQLGTPPNDAVDRNPELPPGSLPRERSEARTAIDPCGGCHSQIDPVGLGMEELDQLGRFRTTYDSGIAVDNLGALPFLDLETFTGAAELAQAMAASPEFGACAAKQWSEYTFGEVLPSSSCAAEVAAGVLEDGGTIQDLIVAMIETETFQSRARDAAGGTAP